MTVKSRVLWRRQHVIYSLMKLASDAIGKRLFDARIKRDLTMDQLAVKAGINQSTISKLERGINEPGAANVEKLALALEVDPCWLAYGTGKIPDWEKRRS